MNIFKVFLKNALTIVFLDGLETHCYAISFYL